MVIFTVELDGLIGSGVDRPVQMGNSAPLLIRVDGIPVPRTSCSLPVSDVVGVYIVVNAVIPGTGEVTIF